MTAAKTIEQKKASGQKNRHLRVRAKISGTSSRPRLFVYKSNRYTQAALIDDVAGKTLLAASTGTMSKVPAGADPFAKVAAARELGKKIASLAKKANVEEVVFDRGGNRYTGRVRALAEGAREGGLKF